MVAAHYQYITFLETYTMEIVLPEKFSFHATKWLAWEQRSERFRVASDLCSKTVERRVAMLTYAMGEKAEEPMTVKSMTLFFKSSMIILL